MRQPNSDSYFGIVKKPVKETAYRINVYGAYVQGQLLDGSNVPRENCATADGLVVQQRSKSLRGPEPMGPVHGI